LLNARQGRCRDVEHVGFAWTDGTLVPRHGATDPGGPLADLTPRVWLEQLAKSDAYLFAEPTRPH